MSCSTTGHKLILNYNRIAVLHYIHRRNEAEVFSVGRVTSLIIWGVIMMTHGMNLTEAYKKLSWLLALQEYFWTSLHIKSSDLLTLLCHPVCYAFLVFSAVWSSHLVSDGRALWLFYSSVCFKSLSYRVCSTAFITQVILATASRIMWIYFRLTYSAQRNLEI